MPRKARIAPKQHIYHLLTRGNNSKTIFKKEEDYKEYINILQRYKAKYHFNLYHYVLMKNHVHLVLETSGMSGSLSEVMKGINISYVQYYKSKYKHAGHFWQDRYKSIIVSNDEYVLACGGYVELNPVRAKITQDLKTYRWSSYNCYAHGKNEPIVDENPIYTALSSDAIERRKKYRRFVRGMIRHKNAMKGEMERRLVYGNKSFIENMNEKYNIEAKIKPKGRPKKDEKGGKSPASHLIS